MWFPNKIIQEVDAVARVHYVGVAHTRLWNEHKRDGELRLLTGWCWTAKDNSNHRQGYKTLSAAYRDAWYVLVQQTEAPVVRRQRLRVMRAA
jgi:hypothetical protein